MNNKTFTIFILAKQLCNTIKIYLVLTPYHIISQLQLFTQKFTIKLYGIISIFFHKEVIIRKICVIENN